jgi:hypothetical protein
MNSEGTLSSSRLPGGSKKFLKRFNSKIDVSRLSLFNENEAKDLKLNSEKRHSVIG